jgi:hypothetical protein
MGTPSGLKGGGSRETLRRGVAILNLGAAQVEAVGPWHLTFTAEEAVRVAKAFPEAAIVPLYFEGWRHFSESRSAVDEAFAAADLSAPALARSRIATEIFQL